VASRSLAARQLQWRRTDMGKIIISENISLDGVIQDPTGLHSGGRGSWFTTISDQDRELWATVEFEEALGAAAMLMGRRSYEWFVAIGWQSRAGEWADRLRSLPKYVVTSSALGGAGWDNSAVLTGGVVTAVSKLKEQVAGDIVVNGSGQLAHTLIEHDLVDELRLITYPIVVGAGERLFGETGGTKPMRLADTRTIGDGLAALTYQRAGAA
jgi:dihydrofolate reductase